MEADMVAISRGIRTKQEVLDDNIRMYKQIFMKVTEECVGIMDEVTTSFLFSLHLPFCFFLEKRPVRNISIQPGRTSILHTSKRIFLGVELVGA